MLAGHFRRLNFEAPRVITRPFRATSTTIAISGADHYYWAMAKKASKKKQIKKSKSRASGKPLIILGLGVAAALAVAAMMTPGSESTPATTLASIDASPETARVRGRDDAALQLVEFGDYQCPTCAAYHRMVSEVMSRYPADVRLEFHHFPLVSIHGNSYYASMAAEAAAEQGKFWEMHDLIFERQGIWAPTSNAESMFAGYAEELGLDMDLFRAAARSNEAEARVNKDVSQARGLNLNSVPSFFVDGRLLPLNLVPDVASWEQMVRNAIASR